VPRGTIWRAYEYPGSAPDPGWNTRLFSFRAEELVVGLTTVVSPLEFKPAYTLGDLLLQHLDALEEEAAKSGGVQQMLADLFAKVYKVRLPLVA
jgi:hypothetical protein